MRTAAQDLVANWTDSASRQEEKRERIRACVQKLRGKLLKDSVNVPSAPTVLFLQIDDEPAESVLVHILCSDGRLGFIRSHLEDVEVLADQGQANLSLWKDKWIVVR